MIICNNNGLSCKACEYICSDVLLSLSDNDQAVPIIIIPAIVSNTTLVATQSRTVRAYQTKNCEETRQEARRRQAGCRDTQSETAASPVNT